MDQSIKYLLNYKINKMKKFKPLDNIDKEIYKIYTNDKKKQTFIKWKLNNKDIVKIYNKKQYDQNKNQRIINSTKYNLDSNNKEKIKKHRQKYFKSKYITCQICGSFYSSINKNVHLKSIKHCYILLKNQLNI